MANATNAFKTILQKNKKMSPEMEFVKKAVTKYKHPDDAYRDICHIFINFKDLRPKIDDYVFDDGHKYELLNLEGCIQTRYQDKRYNTPIRIWFTIKYPTVAPIIYVTPASGMSLRPSKYVASSGRVFLPYVHDWKYPQSNLEVLLQILSLQFGDEPPVFPIQEPSPATTVVPTTLTSTSPSSSYMSYFQSWFSGARPKEPTSLTQSTSAPTTPVTSSTSNTTSSQITTLPCPGCATVFQLVQQQANEIDALKTELRELKQEVHYIKAGRDHEMTSDAVDGSI